MSRAIFLHPVEPEHVREAPVYENGVDFALTPQERTQAAIAHCHLRERRDRLSAMEREREAVAR